MDRKVWSYVRNGHIWGALIEAITSPHHHLLSGMVLGNHIGYMGPACVIFCVTPARSVFASITQREVLHISVLMKMHAHSYLYEKYVYPRGGQERSAGGTSSRFRHAAALRMSSEATFRV